MRQDDQEPLVEPHPQPTSVAEGDGIDEGAGDGSEAEVRGGGGRCMSILRKVTVEPILICHVVAIMMQSTVTTNLLLEKVCVEMGYDKKVCGNLTAHSSIEVVVQAKVTTTLMYISLITSLPAVVFALFLGSWSDKYGRKLPLLMPLTGNFLSSIIYMINAIMHSLPSSYVLFAGLPVALTGGLPTMIMACFAYVSAISTDRSRTTRISYVDLGFSLGSPIGLLLGDLLFYKIGYVGVYAAGALTFVVAFIYGILCIKEEKKSRSGPETVLPESEVALRSGAETLGGVSRSGADLETESSTVSGAVPRSGAESETSRTEGGADRSSGARSSSGFWTRKTCLDLFDTTNVKESFRTAFKQRPNKGRARILLLFFAMCLMVADFGCFGLEYLYFKRRFSWTYNQYVELSVTRLMLQLVVTSGLIPMLSYKLGVRDTVLMLAGCVFKVVSAVIFALAPSPVFLYVGGIVGSGGVVPLVAARSLMSKTTPPEELGKIFSVLASLESLVPIASGPIYTLVYNKGLHVFPGSIYILSASLYVVAGLVFVRVFLLPSLPSEASVPPPTPDVPRIEYPPDSPRFSSLSSGSTTSTAPSPIQFSPSITDAEEEFQHTLN